MITKAVRIDELINLNLLPLVKKQVVVKSNLTTLRYFSLDESIKVLKLLSLLALKTITLQPW